MNTNSRKMAEDLLEQAERLVDGYQEIGVDDKIHVPTSFVHDIKTLLHSLLERDVIAREIESKNKGSKI